MERSPNVQYNTETATPVHIVLFETTHQVLEAGISQCVQPLKVACPEWSDICRLGTDEDGTCNSRLSGKWSAYLAKDEQTNRGAETEDAEWKRGLPAPLLFQFSPSASTHNVPESDSESRMLLPAASFLLSPIIVMRQPTIRPHSFVSSGKRLAPHLYSVLAACNPPRTLQT